MKRILKWGMILGLIIGIFGVFNLINAQSVPDNKDDIIDEWIKAVDEDFTPPQPQEKMPPHMMQSPNGCPCHRKGMERFGNPFEPDDNDNFMPPLPPFRQGRMSLRMMGTHGKCPCQRKHQTQRDNRFGRNDNNIPPRMMQYPNKWHGWERGQTQFRECFGSRGNHPMEDMDMLMGEVKEYLKEVDPKLLEKIESMDESKPQDLMHILPRVIQEMRMFEQMKENNPGMYEQVLATKKVEAKEMVLLEDYKNSKDDKQKEALKRELKSVFAQKFDLKMEQREKKMGQLEERVKRQRNNLEQQKKDKDKTIEKQIKIITKEK